MAATPAPHADSAGPGYDRGKVGPGRRFPARVYRHGDEPDPRFSLANERTYLAWIRTSLALLATSGALLALDLPLHEGWQWLGGALFAAASLTASVWGWIAWAQTERLLRLERPLPGLGGGATVGMLVMLGTVVLAIALVVHELQQR